MYKVNFPNYGAQPASRISADKTLSLSAEASLCPGYYVWLFISVPGSEKTHFWSTLAWTLSSLLKNYEREHFLIANYSYGCCLDQPH